MNNIHGLGSSRSNSARGAPGSGGNNSGVLDQIKSNWASLPLFN